MFGNFKTSPLFFMSFAGFSHPGQQDAADGPHLPGRTEDRLSSGQLQTHIVFRLGSDNFRPSQSVLQPDQIETNLVLPSQLQTHIIFRLGSDNFRPSQSVLQPDQIETNLVLSGQLQIQSVLSGQFQTQSVLSSQFQTHISLSILNYCPTPIFCDFGVLSGSG